MLCLKRKRNQTILINGGTDQEIVIAYLGDADGQAIIGINAPRSMTIHREEVHLRIKNGEPKRVR